MCLLFNQEGNTGLIFLLFQAAMEFLHKLDVPFFKVGSGDTNNLPFLTKSAKKGRPMVVSSGMQSMDTMKKVKHGHTLGY